KLLQFDNIDELLSQSRTRADEAMAEANILAVELSKGRKKVIPALEKTTNEYLGQMGMPNARLKAACNRASAADGSGGLHAFGADLVELLFDANKTGRFEPIGKVASGGELSRLMLAIKAQVAKSVQLPALIFDEIDSGISGEAARQVGLLMRSLASGHQVIAITHQPQIAARAHAHFFVYKQENNGAIRTRLRRLEEAQRVEAIARMLSGEALTESARQIAREMVEAP
nr:DNA repair protein RecN [Chitinophagaceae bacterium]